jgi:hypothetical protein
MNQSQMSSNAVTPLSMLKGSILLPEFESDPHRSDNNCGPLCSDHKFRLWILERSKEKRGANGTEWGWGTGEYVGPDAIAKKILDPILIS